MFQSVISINALGFRGEEIAMPKGRRFRIVALGESTTFGCTFNPEDRTWPEWLERMIRDELKPPRLVEVINAGTPSFTVENNVSRLARDILPLQPDLVISYHGANGFYWLDSAIPPPGGPRPPYYRERPLKLLADVEYRLRLGAYNRQRAGRAPRAGPVGNPLETEYARHYENLIEALRTNGIPLAIANYSMAVNQRSDQEVIEFYRSGFPHVFREIDANSQHTRLVEELARQHDEIHLIDTHPGLDGRHEHFIDLVHFTESGREQIARNIFVGIRPILERMLPDADPDVPGSRSGHATLPGE
jgi:lysophospholipase L1-like esterase